mmetsp:Transcript_60521/g.157253  ORF Transcript_60521/g.157253 Transcript_60521/m.157253 type:complete len:240 (+) Transcript_60521:184-903(+)
MTTTGWFWSPPSPPMPKPKKRRPKSGGRWYTIPSQSLAPSDSRSLSAGAQRKDKAGSGQERQCYVRPKTSKKTREVDDSVFQLGFDFEDEDEHQKLATPSEEDLAFSQRLFDHGFDDDTGTSQVGRSSSHSRAKGEVCTGMKTTGPLKMDSRFDTSFGGFAEGSAWNQIVPSQTVPAMDDSPFDSMFLGDAEGGSKQGQDIASCKVADSSFRGDVGGSTQSTSKAKPSGGRSLGSSRAA